MVDDFQGTVTIAESMFLGGNRLLENNVHFFFPGENDAKRIKPGKGREHDKKGGCGRRKGLF